MIRANPLIGHHGPRASKIIVANPTVVLHNARATEIAPCATNLLPPSQHGARSGKIIPLSSNLSPAGDHHAGIGKPVPCAADALSARAHSTRAAKVIPCATRELPTSQHGPRVREQIPCAIYLLPASFHRTSFGKPVPCAADALPAGPHRTGRRVEPIPKTIDQRPACLGVAVIVKVVASSVDVLPARLQVGAVAVLIPPRTGAASPGAANNRIGFRHHAFDNLEFNAFIPVEILLIGSDGNCCRSDSNIVVIAHRIILVFDKRLFLPKYVNPHLWVDR